MLIDCDTCIARGPSCRDCVVTAILSIAPPRGHTASHSAEPWPQQFDLDEAERDAVHTLAAAGLVPPLRLVSGMSVNAQEIA